MVFPVVFNSEFYYTPKGEDTGQVIVFGADLLLAKVSGNVCALVVHLRNDVKVKGLYVIVHRLMVQEELGQQTEVLTVDLILLPIHLKDQQVILLVDLLSRRTLHVTSGLVRPKGPGVLTVGETELTHKERVLLCVLVGVGRKVPGLHLPLANEYFGDVLDLGNILVLPFQGCQGLVHGIAAITTMALPLIWF